MTFLTLVKLIIITLTMQLLPGWALLSLGGCWKRFKTLDRWILAYFLGMAFYPVLFYLARLVLPGLQIGLNKLILFLFLTLVFNLWQYRKSWKDNFKFEKKDLFPAALLVLILVTRLIPAWQYPYPAWTDSLHHSIITKLVMLNGQLPDTMLPFDPASLRGYHLGLYSLTGSLGLLSNVSPHTALLYYSQITNAFAGLAVFIFLDKKLGRVAALIGMVFVGLISFQPALYFNWGRFTQLASQTMLFPAALLVWMAIEPHSAHSPVASCRKKRQIVEIFLAALLISATALLHFRVAVFFLPLLVFIVLFTVSEDKLSPKERKRVILKTALIALVTIILTLPAIIPAMQSYLTPAEPVSGASVDTPSNKTDIPLSEHPYYKFEYPIFYELGLTKAVGLFAALGLLLGLLFKKTRTLALLTIVWVAALAIEGNLHKFNIPKLAFVNMTGVMIIAYLPGAVGFGLLFETLKESISRLVGPNQAWRNIQPILYSMIAFIAVLFISDRINTIQPFRHFMSNEDQQAMEWLKENTPPDSIIAINTQYWAGEAFHGTDAGYWIPYFAERETTTRTMMSVDAPDYTTLQQRNALVYLLYFTGDETVDTQVLCDMDITYLYSGKAAPFTNLDFNIEALISSPGVKLVYDQNGIQILNLCAKTTELVILQD